MIRLVAVLALAIALNGCVGIPFTAIEETEVCYWQTYYVTYDPTARVVLATDSIIEDDCS